jgi:hypothetical protein
MTLQRVVLKRGCACGTSVLWLGHILSDAPQSIHAKQENNAHQRPVLNAYQLTGCAKTPSMAFPFSASGSSRMRGTSAFD